MPIPTPSDPAEIAHVNQVQLIGLIRRGPLERSLPSGDLVTTFSVRAARPARRGGLGAHRGQAGDTIECSVWTVRLRRVVARWVPGDLVQISGALHRTVRSGSTGVTSRYEVEAAQAVRLVPVPPRVAAVGRARRAG